MSVVSPQVGQHPINPFSWHWMEAAAPGMGICGGHGPRCGSSLQALTYSPIRGPVAYAGKTGDLGLERREVSFPVQGILCRWVDLSSAADPASFGGSLWSSAGSNHTHHGLA